nr:UPF0489 family protein [Paenibacillus alvei]
MREHNWAFAAWEIEKLKGSLKNKSLLVHVDSHLDDIADGVLVPNILNANSEEEIIRAAKTEDYSKGCSSDKNMLKIENFIWPSIARGTVEEVLYVSRDKLDVLSLEKLENSDYEIVSILPTNFSYKYARYMSTREFLNRYTPEEFQKFVGDRTAILDLDIDCFNLSDNDPPIIMPIDQIREEVHGLKDLYPWDVVTIAISPLNCGGDLIADTILTTVLNEFDFIINTAENW